MTYKRLKIGHDMFRARFVEAVVASAIVLVSIPAADAQVIDPTQIVPDTVGSHRIAGVKVQCSDLLESMAKTDTWGRLAVVHEDSIPTSNANPGASPSDFAINGNVISFAGADHDGAISLDVFNANGVSVYRSQEATQARKNARIVYPRQFPGLYYVKLQTEQNDVVFKCLGADACNLVKFSIGAKRASQLSASLDGHPACAIERIGVADASADVEKHYCECPAP